MKNTRLILVTLALAAIAAVGYSSVGNPAAAQSSDHCCGTGCDSCDTGCCGK